METNNQVEAINAALAKMALPINRRDATRGDTVKWLVRNLGQRNQAHPNYPVAMKGLVQRAASLNLLKNSELKDYKEYM